MLNLVIFYCLCQLVIQGMAYLALDHYLNLPTKRYCEKQNMSKKHAKTIYMALGQIENFAITAVVVLVTARASMVGTANLIASAILSILIALEAQVVFLKYNKMPIVEPKNKKATNIFDV